MLNRKCLVYCFAVVLLLLMNLLSVETLTDAQRSIILQYHNAQRLNNTPQAVNMRVMTYDLNLEGLAQQWVNRCKFEHPPKKNQVYTSSGQNIGATGGMSEDDSVDVIMKAWYAEIMYYDYTSNKCWKMCGHYTQMIWATTSRIGCAIQICEGIFEGIPSYFMACQYAKRGNVIGQKPYKI